MYKESQSVKPYGGKREGIRKVTDEPPEEKKGKSSPKNSRDVVNPPLLFLSHLTSPYNTVFDPLFSLAEANHLVFPTIRALTSHDKEPV